ncbi:MAG: hypothetical protein QM719_05635 [Thermomonas sp.]
MHRIVLLIALSWIGLAFASQPVPEAPIRPAPGATPTRQLVATSGTRAMNDCGAVQLDTQRFHALRAGKPDLLAATSRFADAWKLSRAAGYGHEPGPAASAH